MTAEIIEFYRTSPQRSGHAKARAPEGLTCTTVPVVDRRCRKLNADHNGNNPLRDVFLSVSASVTIVGKVVHRRLGFDPSTLDRTTTEEWLKELRFGSERANRLARKFDEAAEQLEKQLGRL